MPNDQPLSVSFRRNDGHRKRIPLRDCTLAEAMSAIERIFSISEHLYTEAEIYRGNELVETMENHSSVRVEPISFVDLNRHETSPHGSTSIVSCDSGDADAVLANCPTRLTGKCVYQYKILIG